MIQPIKPFCFEESYLATKEAMREGEYFGINQMKNMLLEQNYFIWVDEELMEMGIREALNEEGLL